MSDQTRRVLAIILALAMVGSLAAGVILSSLGGGAANSAPDSEASSQAISGGLYWEYHDAVYADAPERGHLKVTDEKISTWAHRRGVVPATRSGSSPGESGG